MQREAEITSQLSHPGVVSIHAKGLDERGYPFYAMQLVQGESLSDAIHRLHGNAREQPDWSNGDGRNLLGHFRDCCLTIAFAHKNGVIHRDIKPSNVVLGSFGETYLVDWGLARFLDDGEDITDGSQSRGSQITGTDASESTLNANNHPELTQAGSTIGTPAFMSPEQASAEQAGMSSDIFNLGASLYSILTGSPPYQDASLVKTIELARNANFRAPGATSRRVPSALNAICLKAMNSRPEDRYKTAKELADDVERFLADAPVQAMPEPMTEKARRWVKRNRTLVTSLLTSAAIAFVILAASLGVLYDKNRKLATSEAETKASLYSQRISLAHAEWAKNNPVRAKEILDDCPDSLRQWEWHHLKWLVTRNKPWKSKQGTAASITAFDFHPSGNTVVFGEAAGRMVFWDPRTGEQSVVETGIEILDIAFDRAGTRIAVCGKKPESSRGLVQIWDSGSKKILADGTIRRTMGLGSVCWDEDRDRLAFGGGRGKVYFLATSDLDVERSFKAHRVSVAKVAFQPDGKLVSAGADGLNCMWSVDGDKLSEAQSHKDGTTAMFVGADSILTGGSDMLVRVWKNQQSDEPAGKFQHHQSSTLVGHTDKILSVALSPDGKLAASAGLDRNIRIWDVQRNESIAVIRQHSSHVRKVAFDPTGKLLVSAGDDNQINIWKLEQLVRPFQRGSLVEFTQAKDQLLVGDSKQIGSWDSMTGVPDFRITDQPETLMEIVASPNRPIAASLYRRGQVMIWSTADGSVLHHIEEQDSPAYCATFSVDGQHLWVGYHGGQILQIDVKTGEIVNTGVLDLVVYRIAASSSGKYLVTGHRDGAIHLLDPKTLQVKRKFQAHEGILLDLAANPLSDEISSVGKDGVIRIWDMSLGEPRKEINVGASWLNCIEYTVDGKRLVSGSEHTITFWDSQSGAEVLSLSIDRCVHSMSFSPDGKSLAIVGEDPRVRIWRADSFGQ